MKRNLPSTARYPASPYTTAEAERELRIRSATPRDAEALGFFFDMLLRRDYFLRRGQLRDMLCSRRHTLFLATLADVLVGVAILTRGSRLVNALVHPAYRGLGIGRALVNGSGAAEARAKLDISSGDPSGFYRRLGFRPTGERNRKGNIVIFRRPQATGIPFPTQTH